jgi:maltodextrin utilization protein YvdJ
MKAWRTDLARLGYTLAGGSVSVVFAMWSRTLTLGGLHCFDAALVMLRLFHKSVSCSAFFAVCSVLESIDFYLWCLRLPILPSVALSFSCIDRSLSQ